MPYCHNTNQAIQCIPVHNKEFAKYKELKKTYGESVGQELTDLSDDPIDFFESKIFNLGNQEIMAKIKESGGRKESLDASDQAFVSKISTALKTNTFDRFFKMRTDCIL